jgi:pentatricopeptide repeat protein
MADANTITTQKPGGIERRRPDSGQNFLPVSNVPDNSPRPLDHFKRGYNERMECREREMTGLNNLLPYDRLSPIPKASTLEQKKWQPPPSVPRESDHNSNINEEEERIQGAQSQSNNYYGPPGGSNNYNDDKLQQQQPPSYNNSNANTHDNNTSFNNNYNKYDDKLYTRSSNNYDDRSHQSRNFNNSYKAGGSSGVSMEEVVDRLCHPRANVFEELDLARSTSPEFFLSGRAITAVLSQLGRRRQMRVAMQVWRWMEQTQGITRNVYHYNALINVCEKIKDWKGALDLLKQMDEENVPKNEITYSSAISACEKGGNWRTALDLLKTMKEKKIMPTAIAYNAGMS